MTKTDTPVRSGGMRQVGSTAMIKIFVMGLSGVLGILTSRVILQSFGTEAYAQYGLLSSFPTLLPFADLGIAAVVINEVAGSRSPRTDDVVRRTIVTALRILMVSGGIMIVVATVITVFGWWPTLLGSGLMPGGNLTAGLCLVIFGIAVPLTVGQRILVGLKKTNVQVASQAIVAPFMLLVIGALALLMIPAGTFLSVVSYIGNALLSVLCLWIAARALSPQIGQAIRLIFRVRAYRGVAVLGLAWPMLVQTLAQPIAFQTDRILLSHVGTSQDLAEYNLSSQLFGLVLQTIAAAGVALWPIYAGHRAAGRIASPTKPTFWFLGGGLVVGGALALLSPWLVHFIAGGRIQLSPILLVSFVAYVALQAAKYPIGMYMTDKAGLKFQVVPSLAMIPLNLGVSWLLIAPFGAAGPIIGSALTVLLLQIIPNLWYVSKDLARRRAEQRAAPVDETSEAATR